MPIAVTGTRDRSIGSTSKAASTLLALQRFKACGENRLREKDSAHSRRMRFSRVCFEANLPGPVEHEVYVSYLSSFKRP